MTLEQTKARLEAQLSAIQLLEGLDADQLSAVREVLSNQTAPTTTADYSECPQCGESFKTRGLKRHITMSHG